MSQVAKRRIQVASFATSDISSGHRAAMVVGVLLIGASALLAVASNSNARASADGKGAARLLASVSSQVLPGTQLFIGGGSERLSQAATMSGGADAAFQDLASSANSPLILPSLKGPAAAAYTAWGSLKAAVAPLALPATLGAELSDSMGRSVSNFAQVLRKVEGTGRTKAHESAVRLYTYAESGFGQASVARVEYDLQTLSSELGATELRGDVAFLDPLIQMAHSANGKKVTKEELTGAFEAAKAGSTSADTLAAAAGQAQGALWLGASAAVLALLGLAAVVIGLRSATSEFSKRYTRSMQQFRGDEAAREQLVNGLRATAEGDFESDITVASASGEFNEIANLVNAVLSVARDRLHGAAATMSAGAESGDRTLKLAGKAREIGAGVLSELGATEEALAACSSQSGAIALDSRALVSATNEAVARSADATRVAQDAASRLEAMREGLQDTSKRIKRLGERSQEINGVVESLELLSEQIGVLALNASLEAERAGEAGSGFRLVAKEVQSLATRSEDALQRIVGLVHGVQADARSAAESVERTTGQVVAGANVGSVSHALLGVLAPLAESIGAMAKSVSEVAVANADALALASKSAGSVIRATGDIVTTVGELCEPLESGQRSLRAAAAALSSAGDVDALV